MVKLEATGVSEVKLLMEEGVLAVCDPKTSGDTDLFEEVHEARSEAPGFVSVTLQRADGHLSGSLRRHGNHEHCVVHQGSVCLRRRRRGEECQIII